MADTHVGRNIPRVVGELRREAYQYAFSKAIDVFISEGVDYIIHAGDLFEKRSMTSSDSIFVKNEFHRLINSIKENEGKNVRIIMVRGNHDGTSDNNSLDYVEHPLAEYLKVIGDVTLSGGVELFEDEKLVVAAVGYHPYIAPKFAEIKPVVKESLSKASGRRILLLHAFIKGYHQLPPGIPTHSILTKEDFQDLDVETIVCGHHHTRCAPLNFQGKQIITPGATEAIDLADEGEHGVSILEGASYRFIPIEPLHDICNLKILSEGAVKPLDWFKSETENRLTSFVSKLNTPDRASILRIVVEGKSDERSFRLDADLESLAAKAKESNPNLLHIQVENRVECVEQTFFKPLGGQDSFILEVLKPLGDLTQKGMPIAEEVEMTLDEKASQKTGLLMPSDRQPLIEKWVEVLTESVRNKRRNRGA